MSARWQRFRDLLAGEALPTALIDLDAVDANLDTMLAQLGDRPITLRIASTSIRVPALLKYLVERGGHRLRGLMCYTAREAAYLADQGFDDLLVAYPVARPEEARAFAAMAASGVTAIATVDDPEHVAVLVEAATEADTVIPVCIDVDCSWRPAGLHVGVRRSPVRGSERAMAVASAVGRQDRLRLTAVLAYEAQVAGLPDRAAPWMRPAVRLIKSRSVALAMSRRAEVVRALTRAGHAITVVNGGGTGSLASTGADPSVTEVTAGSGFLCPHLFDGYKGLDLQPAAFFAIPVVRRSDPGFVTCAGGGYPASGAAGADRLPAVWAPAGLQPLGMEGFGEVQTPFQVPDGVALDLGDPVICRHGKAGELAERFPEVLLVRGDTIERRVPTYRGDGRFFL